VKEDIVSLPLQQLQQALADLGQPPYRAKQLFGWLHARRAQSFDDMNNLPAALRAKLAASWRMEQPDVVRRLQSADGTEKLLLRLHDGHTIETVVMRYHHGVSLCVSSQVGCRMGCTFCASGHAAFVRSLSAGEMAAQLYTAEALAGERIDHLVLMGIGEPLDNFDNVMDFIAIVTDEAGADLSMRNISLSTCGLVPMIEKLAERKLGLTLSVSLHAANDATRSRLMPVNKAYPLARLMAACRAYREKTGRRVSYEYALVAGQNDADTDADALADLLRGTDGHVNLIPVNPVLGLPATASDAGRTAAFAARLKARGVNATVRRRLGADIDAACGQLRLQEAGRIPEDTVAAYL